MIALVPRLYPDELLYSFCSRYHERMGYRSRESTGRDLFNRTAVKVAFDFPAGLRTLTHATSWSDWKTVDQLIDSHSLLPFYAPFVSTGKLSRIRASMAADDGGTIHARLGVLTHYIRSQNFRYCSRCVESDRSRFGETYWHRLHQLPGIDACSIHKIFLNQSFLNTRHRANDQAFVTAERAISTLTCKQLEPKSADHAVHLKLALDADWLLHNGMSANSIEGNRQRYFGLLYERSLAGYEGPVKLKTLIKCLKQHYSEQVLDRFHCSLHSAPNWVTRLIHGMGKSQNPIEHLLLLQFLGLSAPQFFESPLNRQPFGDGPWPCLNPTCDKFRQLTINRYDKSQTTGYGHPRATFSCKCGLTYYRIGPDNNLEDRYCATGFVCVTQAWVSTLKQHFSKRPLLDSLARRFCTDSETIRMVLEDVGVIFSRRIKKTITIVGEHNPPTTKFLIKRRVRRLHLLQMLAKNKDIPRSKFRMQNGIGYGWLALHDKKWLRRHLPPKKLGGGPSFKTNWKEQDKMMAEQVRHEAKRIKSSPGKLARASKTLIARNLGKLHVVIKRGSLLPLTLQALAEASETIEQFAVRRINQKAESLREQGNSASIWQLQSLAAVSNGVAKRPLVRDALKSYSNSLHR